MNAERMYRKELDAFLEAAREMANRQTFHVPAFRVPFRFVPGSNFQGFNPTGFSDETIDRLAATARNDAIDVEFRVIEDVKGLLPE